MQVEISTSASLLTQHSSVCTSNLQVSEHLTATQILNVRACTTPRDTLTYLAPAGKSLATVRALTTSEPEQQQPS